MILGTDEVQDYYRITKTENEELNKLDNSHSVGLLQLSSDKKVQVEEIKLVNIGMFKSCIQCLAKIPPAVETSRKLSNILLS